MTKWTRSRLFTFAVLGVAAVTIASCDREVTEPRRSNLSPRVSRLGDVVPAPTYGHPDRGCYLWGPDPLYSPWQSYGDPTPLTVCGLSVSVEATGHDGFFDTTVVWFRPLPVVAPAGTAAGTLWQGGPGNGAPIGGTGPVFAHFNKPVMDVHVVPWCSLQPGDSITAYDAAGQVLERHEIPVSGLCPAAANEVVLASANIWTVKVEPARPIVNQYWQGAFELWFTPAPIPHLLLSASKLTGVVGDTVTYSASSSDGSAFTITRWSWKANALSPKGYSPKLAWTSCGTTNPCRDTPGASGTMTVYGTVGGLADSASQQVTIDLKSCGPVGDAILDSADVRTKMKDAWAESGAAVDTIISNHREGMFAVYRNTADGSVFAQEIPGTSTPCGWDGTIPTISGSTLLATFHVHPFGWGQTYPTSCGTMAGSTYNNPIPAFNSAGRASGDDWDSSRAYGVPGYVIDYDGIYRYDGVNANIDKTLGFSVVKNLSSVYKTYAPRFDSKKLCGLP